MTDTKRPSHARTQTIGLTLITAAFVFIVAVSLVLFGGDDITPFLVFTAIAGGFAFLTYRFNTQWARALGIVGTVLTLGAFFLGFGLFQPFSPLEFTVAIAYVMGIGLALVGGIRAMLASRKGKDGPTPTEQRLPKIVAGIVGVAAVVSLFGFILTRQEVSDAEAAGATVIEMTAFEFAPETSTTPSGSKLLITNSDPFVHDFTLEEFDIAETVGPRGEVLVDLTGVSPGTYEYVCTLHFDGTSGMSGTLVVGG